MLPGGQPRYASTAANDTPWPRVAECSRMRRSSIVALAAALLPARIHGQGASSMHPIDFDGDGDIDIVKSSPIGIVWLENHGVDKEWETHIISLNQNIKDAVAAHKRHRKFVDVMEGRGVAPVSALSDEPPVVVAGAPEDVSVDVGGDVVEEQALYVEQEL